MKEALGVGSKTERGISQLHYSHSIVAGGLELTS
jgi:hypothetical protein